MQHNNVAAQNGKYHGCVKVFNKRFYVILLSINVTFFVNQCLF